MRLVGLGMYIVWILRIHLADVTARSPRGIKSLRYLPVQTLWWTANVALLLAALVGADAADQALLAHALAEVMLAYLRSATLLALLLAALVGTDAAAQALLAPTHRQS
jgi:hypothetical protein